VKQERARWGIISQKSCHKRCDGCGTAPSTPALHAAIIHTGKGTKEKIRRERYEGEIQGTDMKGQDHKTRESQAEACCKEC